MFMTGLLTVSMHRSLTRRDVINTAGYRGVYKHVRHAFVGNLQFTSFCKKNKKKKNFYIHLSSPEYVFISNFFIQQEQPPF